MYALIQTADQGSLWRSDDAGVDWSVVSWDRSLIGRAGYYIRLAVNPQNPDDVFISSSSFHRSQDGGKTFSGNGGGPFAFTQGQASCGDCHDIWIDPKDPVRYVLTDDAGANINTKTGNHPRVAAQRADVSRARRQPRAVLDLQQPAGRRHDARTVDDDPSRRPTAGCPRAAPCRGPPASARVAAVGGRGAAAPARRQPRHQRRRRDRRRRAAAPDLGGAGGGRANAATGAGQPNIGGCESGFTIPDPTDADIVYASCYGNKVTRWDARTGTARSIEPWMVSLDSPPNEAEVPLPLDGADGDRSVRSQQRALRLPADPEDHQRRPVVDRVQPRSLDQGSRRASSRTAASSATTSASTTAKSSGTIEYSKIQRGLIWAGTNDGKLWYTKDGGANWNDLTKNFKDLPPWGTFTQIWPSTFDPGTAYVARRLPPDGRSQAVHLQDDRLRRDLDEDHRQHPDRASARLRPVAVGNPNRKGMLFAGTGRAFYYSLDDGDDVDAVQGRPAAGAGQLDHRRAALPRRRRLDLRPRPLHPAEHHAARADRAARTAPSTTTKLFDPAPIFRQARERVPAGRPAALQFALATAPAAPIKMEILDAAAR